MQLFIAIFILLCPYLTYSNNQRQLVALPSSNLNSRTSNNGYAKPVVAVNDGYNARQSNDRIGHSRNQQRQQSSSYQNTYVDSRYNNVDPPSNNQPAPNYDSYSVPRAQPDSYVQRNHQHDNHQNSPNSQSKSIYSEIEYNPRQDSKQNAYEINYQSNSSVHSHRNNQHQQQQQHVPQEDYQSSRTATQNDDQNPRPAAAQPEYTNHQQPEVPQFVDESSRPVVASQNNDFQNSQPAFVQPNSPPSNSNSQSAQPASTHQHQLFGHQEEGINEINNQISIIEQQIVDADRRIHSNERALKDGKKRMSEDEQKILKLLVELDQKEKEILRNTLKKLANDRLISKLKARLNAVDMKLLEITISAVERQQMTSDRQVLEKDSHDLLVEKDLIESQREIHIIEKKMLETLVSIKETIVQIEQNNHKLAHGRGRLSNAEAQHIQSSIAMFERQIRSGQHEWTSLKMNHKQAQLKKELFLIQNKLDGERKTVLKHLIESQKALFEAEKAMLDIEIKFMNEMKSATDNGRQAAQDKVEWAREWEMKAGSFKANWHTIRGALEKDATAIAQILEQKMPNYY